jgi:hypothetical protein
MRWTVVVTVLAGCAFNNHDTGGDAGGGDGGVPAPCVLADLSMAASTLSGCSDPGTADGPRGTARFNNPVNVALGPSGVAYVLDFDSSLLRKVDPMGNVTTLFADKRFNRPFGIIMASSGQLYIECDNDDKDQHSNTSGTIWKIDPANPYGAGGATIVVAGQTRPRGLAILPDNRIAVTDYVAMVVNIVDPVSNTVSLLAGASGVVGAQNGHGAAATFAQPWDLVVSTSGDLIVTEYQNHVLRRVTLTGDVTVYAGTVGVPGHQDGPIATALFNQPKGMTMDASGAIYITEAGNHDIRKIAGGMVTTLAGKTDGGYSDNSDPMSAEFYGIEGLDVSADGKRFVIADGNDGDDMPYNHVRELTLP